MTRGELRKRLNASDMDLTAMQVTQIMYFVDEYVSQVIGEDEIAGTYPGGVARNELRAEQRKRAGLEGGDAS